MKKILIEARIGGGHTVQPAAGEPSLADQMRQAFGSEFIALEYRASPDRVSYVVELQTHDERPDADVHATWCARLRAFMAQRYGHQIGDTMVDCLPVTH
jgi:hypothetical protein